MAHPTALRCYPTFFRVYQVQPNQMFAQTPGLALMVTYVPDVQSRGLPLDHFTWRVQDSDAKSSAELDVWINVQCGPGYYRVNPFSALVTNLTVAGATSDQCFPCPAGMCYHAFSNTYYMKSNFVYVKSKLFTSPLQDFLNLPNLIRLAQTNGIFSCNACFW